MILCKKTNLKKQLKSLKLKRKNSKKNKGS